MAPYHISAYSRSALGDLLNKCSHRGRAYTEGKSHLPYLDEYLTFINTRTILVEEAYTDRDYLEDYTAYYARCHEEYARLCTRLHFFKEVISDEDIRQLLGGDQSVARRLKESYLGFIVVKPLPSTIIGRTCLATYGNQTRDRAFEATRNYKVHIFGMELEVRSLAFQEQDTDVAACATSALWSTFHATGLLFQRPIPSPADITKAATAFLRYVDRSLPALNGLSAEQMADAVRSVGLEPFEVSAQDPDLFRISARSYLRAGIPCLLLGSVFNAVTDRKIGLHAVTVVGYSTPSRQKPSVPFGPSQTQFLATRIEKLYAHDDQVGPFARMELIPNSKAMLTTSWRNHAGSLGDIFFEPDILIVPLYHKIRVPITSLLPIICLIDQWIEMPRAAGLLSFSERLEWDVALVDNSVLKSDVFGDSQTNAPLRLELLTTNLPHYVWRVAAVSNNTRVFDLLFDATDLLQGGLLVGGLAHDKSACVSLGEFFAHPVIAANLKSQGKQTLEKVADWFAVNRGKF